MNLETPKTFLVYIPCHSDYERARQSAILIRRQFDDFQDSNDNEKFVLKIIVSANGVNISPEEQKKFEKSTDSFHYFSEPLGGDTNINLGFLKALEIKPNYFWILSANEFLVDGSISYILNTITSNVESDLYVTNSMNRSTSYQTSNVFIDIPPGSGYGLISSVIYNFNKMRGAFSAGPRFAWTGWGQLAVVQTACNILGSLKVTEIPDAFVYEKPFTDVNSGFEKSEFEFVRSTYAHSFFGMPILIFALFGRNKSIRNRVLLAWLKKNWFKLRYFKQGAQRQPDSKHPQFDSRWIQQTARLILCVSGLAIFLLSTFGSVLNFERARKYKILISMKRNFFQ